MLYLDDIVGIYTDVRYHQVFGGVGVAHLADLHGMSTCEFFFYFIPMWGVVEPTEDEGMRFWSLLVNVWK